MRSASRRDSNRAVPTGSTMVPRWTGCAMQVSVPVTVGTSRMPWWPAAQTRVRALPRSMAIAGQRWQAGHGGRRTAAIRSGPP